MNSHYSGSSKIFECLSSYIYTFLDLDDNTSLLILKFEEDEKPMKPVLNNLTSSVISKFLNTTRAGSAHKHAGISFKAFLSSMLVSVIYFMAQVMIFTILRQVLKELYQAKYLQSPGSLTYSNKDSTFYARISRTLRKYFNWMISIYRPCIKKYQHDSGLDAYFFLRFLRAISFFFLVLSTINIPILIPIHYVFGYDSKELSNIENRANNTVFSSLDRISMSNIIPSKSDKLVFHFILSLFVILFFHIMLLSELKHIYYLSGRPESLSSFQSVMFIENIPHLAHNTKSKIIGYLNDIQPLQEDTPAITFVPKRHSKALTSYRKLKKLRNQLEKTATIIILEKYFIYLTNDKTLLKQFHPGRCKRLAFYWNYFKYRTKTMNRLLSYSVKLRKRKGKNFEWLPQVTIVHSDFLKTNYTRIEKIVEELNNEYLHWQFLCQNFHNVTESTVMAPKEDIEFQIMPEKAFVTFNSPATAHKIAELVSARNIDEWNNIILAPHPCDILWSNISASNTLAKTFRRILAAIFSFLIIIGWVIPVAVIGLVSQVPYLTSLIPLLSRLEINSVFLNDIITNFIPIITLVFLTECVPYIFRWLSYLRCCRTGAEIELDVQKWFFVFLFVHVFLVVTISSGISFVVESLLNNPVSITTLLAHELPKSSNFFCSFILIRGLAYSGGNLIQLKELLTEVFYYRLTVYTSHKRSSRIQKSLSFQWGSAYPIFSVLGCIGIIYSVISPIILPLCSLAFCLVFFSLKYQLEYQYNGENRAESNGKIYVQSLLHLYAGVYCMEFCLIGLFALSNSYKLSTCMIIVFIITVIVHYLIAVNYVYRLTCPSLCTPIDNSADKSKGKIESSPLEKGESFTIPFLSGDFDSTIWLPNDQFGLVQNEKESLEKLCNTNCDTTKYSIHPTGEVYFNTCG